MLFFMDPPPPSATQAINISRMRKNFPDEFDFLPKSFTDYKEYLAEMARRSGEKRRRNKEKKFYIVKVRSGGALPRAVSWGAGADGPRGSRRTWL